MGTENSTVLVTGRKQGTMNKSTFLAVLISAITLTGCGGGLNLKKEINVNASADKAWKVAAHDFAKIDKWMSEVPHSSAISGVSKVKHAPMVGRTCDVGFAKVDETFLQYDEKNKVFMFEITGMPKMMFKKAVARWSVDESGPNRSILKVESKTQLAPLGVVFYPLMKWKLNSLTEKITEEFKYYVENGRPHPRKLKAIRNQ